MAEVQPEFTSRLPHWLRWYLGYGLEGKSGRDHRRQMTCNIIMAFAVLTGVAYAVFCILYNADLWPTSLIGLAISLQFSIVPIIFRRYPMAASLFALLFSTVAFTTQSYLTGVNSGLYLYLFLVSAVIIAFYGAERLWFLTFCSAVGVFGIFTSLFVLQGPALAAANDTTFQAIMLVFSVTVVAILLLGFGYVTTYRAETAEDALEAEHARSEALLYNLLPTEIAARLKDAPDQTIADSLDHTAILFADIVDFTPRSARMTPEALVKFLNRIFSTFDRLAAKHGLEKIKTIGDAYMVAAGLPQPVERPVHRVAEMAFDMLGVLRNLSEELGEDIEIRIGLHAGPVVAGVIGHQKLFYDVWGDTVNTASRMESHGAPGRIQVTAAAREALKDDFGFEPRGVVEIKGIGQLQTWWLLQRT